MNNLKILRHEYGLTQNELAEKLKISRISIARFEEGTRFPRIDTLIAIADFFKVSIDFLVGRSKIRSIQYMTISKASKRKNMKTPCKSSPKYLSKSDLDTIRSIVISEVHNTLHDCGIDVDSHHADL